MPQMSVGHAVAVAVGLAKWTAVLGLAVTVLALCP
jgi:hypothetical protein